MDPASKPPACVTCPLFVAPAGSPAIAHCRAYAPDWRSHVEIPADHPGCGFHPDWPAWARAYGESRPYPFPEPAPAP